MAGSGNVPPTRDDDGNDENQQGDHKKKKENVVVRTLKKTRLGAQDRWKEKYSEEEKTAHLENLARANKKPEENTIGNSEMKQEQKEGKEQKLPLPPRQGEFLCEFQSLVVGEKLTKYEELMELKLEIEREIERRKQAKRDTSLNASPISNPTSTKNDQEHLGPTLSHTEQSENPIGNGANKQKGKGKGLKSPLAAQVGELRLNFQSWLAKHKRIKDEELEGLKETLARKIERQEESAVPSNSVAEQEKENLSEELDDDDLLSQVDRAGESYENWGQSAASSSASISLCSEDNSVTRIEDKQKVSEKQEDSSSLPCPS